MMQCSDFIKTEFPLIDDDLKQYVQDVLENGADDFQDSDEIYEAVGEVLHEIAAEKTEKEIRCICDKLLNMLRPTKNTQNTNGLAKVLHAPVHLGSMAANLESTVDDMKSIWVMQRDDSLKVDAKKLEKAQAKLQEKAEKRQKETPRVGNNAPKLESATASQVTSKKEYKLEAKGNNKTQDIRIENFDIAYGDR
nr:ATP-binding cassette sub-family F member 3-like [Onthophagus taurus]